MFHGIISMETWTFIKFAFTLICYVLALVWFIQMIYYKRNPPASDFEQTYDNWGVMPEWTWCRMKFVFALIFASMGYFLTFTNWAYVDDCKMLAKQREYLLQQCNNGQMNSCDYMWKMYLEDSIYVAHRFDGKSYKLHISSKTRK